MTKTQRQTTQDAGPLVTAYRDGDPASAERLYELAHDEITALASYLLRGEDRAVTFATGDLVNEAAVRVLQSPSVDVRDRAHFIALAAQVMRRVLIDAARKRRAAKRDALCVTMASEGPHDPDRGLEVLALEAALARLRAIEPDRADIVVMRYYGGMSLEDIAAVRGVSEATVKRAWRATRLWLQDALSRDVL